MRQMPHQIPCPPFGERLPGSSSRLQGHGRPLARRFCRGSSPAPGLPHQASRASSVDIGPAPMDNTLKKPKPGPEGGWPS